MSKKSILHGEHHEPCTMRRSYKSAFLHPGEEIQGLTNLPGGDTRSHKSAMGVINKMLPRLFPSINKGQTD
jgi:hypothetical protein